MNKPMIKCTDCVYKHNDEKCRNEVRYRGLNCGSNKSDKFNTGILVLPSIHDTVT